MQIGLLGYSTWVIRGEQLFLHVYGFTFALFPDCIDSFMPRHTYQPSELLLSLLFHQRFKVMIKAEGYCFIF